MKPAKPFNIEDVKDRAERLKIAAGALYGTVAFFLSPDYLAEHKDGIDKCPLGGPLGPIAKAVDGVMTEFDFLQRAIGLLPGDEPRHDAFLHGRLVERPRNPPPRGSTN
jgi:hypothetical protein